MRAGLCLLLTLCFISNAHAQVGEALTPGQEKMQSLAALIGTWQGTNDKGETVAPASYEWINNRSYIQMVIGDVRHIIGWDLTDEQFVGWGFGSHGGQGRVIWTPAGKNSWTQHSEWLDRSGKPAIITSKIVVSGDKLRVESKYGDNPLRVINATRLGANEINQQNTQRWVERFNKHSAAELAQEYAEKCDVVNTGTFIEKLGSRTEMEESFAAFFSENPAAKTSIADVSYERLSDTLVVESGVFNMTDLAQGEPNLRGMYSTIYAYADGRWQIVHERTWLPPGTELNEATKTALHSSKLGSYLVGNWKASGTIEGAPTTGNMTVKPVAGGGAIFFEWTTRTGDQISRGSAISGVDSATGGVLEVAFGDGGKSSHWTNHYDKPLGDALGKTTGKRTSMLDSKEVNETININRTSQDRFEYQISRQGEPRLEWVFERQK